MVVKRRRKDHDDDEDAEEVEVVGVGAMMECLQLPGSKNNRIRIKPQLIRVL
jgi:hypothetical protein